ncbi:hypothetical protein Tco_0674375, partial [Tanacetum coccineum]
VESGGVGQREWWLVAGGNDEAVVMKAVVMKWVMKWDMYIESGGVGQREWWLVVGGNDEAVVMKWVKKMMINY